LFQDGVDTEFHIRQYQCIIFAVSGDDCFIALYCYGHIHLYVLHICPNACDPCMRTQSFETIVVLTLWVKGNYHNCYCFSFTTAGTESLTKGNIITQLITCLLSKSHQSVCNIFVLEKLHTYVLLCYCTFGTVHISNSPNVVVKNYTFHNNTLNSSFRCSTKAGGLYISWYSRAIDPSKISIVVTEC